MNPPNGQALTLVLRHIGERLTMRRIKTDNGVEELRLTGSLPAHRQGPPLHIHSEEVIPDRRVAGDSARQISRDCLAGMPKPMHRCAFSLAGVCLKCDRGESN